MVRIGVLADTHLAGDGAACRSLAKLVERHFAAVDLILHAGDIVDPGLLATFAPIPVYAVRGNMDPATVDTPLRRVITVAGLRIGLIHGWGAPDGIVERVVGEFVDTPLDVLVFGHTHEPCCRWQGGLLLFNPGSATDRRRMPWASVGILEIEEGSVRGRIVQLEG
jgi:hypothetical protein